MTIDNLQWFIFIKDNTHIYIDTHLTVYIYIIYCKHIRICYTYIFVSYSYFYDILHAFTILLPAPEADILGMSLADILMQRGAEGLARCQAEARRTVLKWRKLLPCASQEQWSFSLYSALSLSLLLYALWLYDEQKSLCLVKDYLRRSCSQERLRCPG